MPNMFPNTLPVLPPNMSASDGVGPLELFDEGNLDI
jgi:hypothetical protein